MKASTASPYIAVTPGVWLLEGFPDLLAVHRRAPARYPCLLETAAPGPAHARYDILFAHPCSVLSLHEDGVLRHDGSAIPGDDFLRELDRLWATERQQSASHSLPFHGGWCLYFSYEFGAHLEPRVPRSRSASQRPLALALRCPAALVRDHATGRTYLVAESTVTPDQIEQIRADVADCDQTNTSAWSVDSLVEDDAQTFLDGVARIQNYIRAGDVFQVNLSRRWRMQLRAAADPADVYACLRHANPAPFAALLSYSDSAIVSSSPERLVQVRDGAISTRPIAGTWPRSEDPAKDARAMENLIAHPKERAEHVMLLDLERNDLGRICRSGSVHLSELMHVETYRYVHHLVSEVRGTPRPDVTPGETIRAVFPGGTITGCPKIRCMEIIRELEDATRGAYTGSLGYLNRDGSLDLNILIRTLTLQGNEIEFRAGSGIVADSNPERELRETRAKARGLLAALGIAP